MVHSQTIETYGTQPNNRNIWSSRLTDSFVCPGTVSNTTTNVACRTLLYFAFRYKYNVPCDAESWLLQQIAQLALKYYLFVLCQKLQSLRSLKTAGGHIMLRKQSFPIYLFPRNCFHNEIPKHSSFFFDFLHFTKTAHRTLYIELRPLVVSETAWSYIALGLEWPRTQVK